MKKICSIILCIAFLFTQTGYGFAAEEPDLPDIEFSDEELEFSGIDDPAMLQYVKDSVYANLEETYGSDDLIIEDINAIYISQEYLEEIAFNTKTNLYFGYSLADLNAAFEGKRYIFTCGSDGQTAVQEFEKFPDNSDTVMLKNIMVGTGVILVCVTVTVISGGLASGAAVAGGAKTVSLIFAASAKTAAKMAISGAVFSAATKAVTRGIESGDMYETVRAAELSATEGYKWSAISGAVVGGAKEAIRIAGIKAQSIPSPGAAEDEVAKAYQCTETQVTFKGGQRVPYNTPSATRPDALRFVDGHWEAIEVKCYNLSGATNLSGLKKELTRQITDRCANLPQGVTQRIVLDVTGRGYTKAFTDKIVTWIHGFLDPIYPNIPIDIFGGVL